MESFLETLAPRLRAVLAQVFRELFAGRDPGTVPAAAVVHSAGRSWVPALAPADAGGAVGPAADTSTTGSDDGARARWWAPGWPTTEVAASAGLRALEIEIGHWAGTHVSEAEREEWEFQLFAALGSALGSPEVRAELGPEPVLLVADRGANPHLSVVSLQLLNENHPHPERVAEAKAFWASDPEPLPEEATQAPSDAEPDPAATTGDSAAAGVAAGAAGTGATAADGSELGRTGEDAGAQASTPSLVDQDVVVMHQVTSFLSNDFDILDEHDRAVGRVLTTGSGFWGGSRTFEVADADGTVLMHVEDTRDWGRDRYVLTDGAGSALAHVVQRSAFFATKVEIEVTDGGLLELHGSFWDFDFEVVDGGTRVARVSRSSAGFLSGKDRYVVELEDRAGPRERLAVIGATIALDLIRGKRN
ncbi:LURP-one-related/scramblase family protein [Georgenia sp. Z1344]|uniref:LURP-one-related/scramblase family protein n=1 Tax=Georgenia sp. Z1344 TaxID=3416706 RepID=UPI003CFA8D98